MLTARLNAQQVINAYTANAWIYDLWAWLTESRARKIAMRYAAVRNGEEILEVAVGTGLSFRELLVQNPAGMTHGVDLTPAMLERARQKVVNVEGKYSLEIGNAHQLAYSSKSVDLLVNNYMFDLMREEEFVPLLEEFSRIVKSGGRMVLTNMAEPRRIWHSLWQLVYRINPKWMGGCRGVSLAAYITKAGLQVESHSYVSQFGFPSEIILVRNP